MTLRKFISLLALSVLIFGPSSAQVSGIIEISPETAVLSMEQLKEKSDNNNQEASFELAERYFYGIDGLERNLQEAQKYYHAASAPHIGGWAMGVDGVCSPMIMPSRFAEAATQRIEEVKIILEETNGKF